MANSPVATLEARTTTQAATASSNKGLRTGNQLTGQWLYAKFVEEASNAEVTKQALIRKYADTTSGVDTATFKAALIDMVKVAETAGPVKHAVAKTRASEMRTQYGAFKHIGEAKLREYGFPEDNRVSYHEAVSICRNALKAEGISWEGYAKVTDAEREAKRVRKQESQALNEVQQANPRQQNETMQDWLARCAAVLDDAMEKIKEGEQEKEINSYAKRVFDMVTVDGVTDTARLRSILNRATFLLEAMESSTTGSISPM